MFRRRESLHERLAREGGLSQGEPPPHDTTPRWGETGIHGVARPRRWDAVVLAESPYPGQELDFVALPDGTLLVEDEVVERLAVLEALPELRGLGAELVRAQVLEVGLDRRDVGGLLAQPLEAPALAEAQRFFE